MRLIDADALVFEYGGLAKIHPSDGYAIAEYFANQVKAMPTIEPELKTRKWSNKDWIDFLSKMFEVSRTSARDMLHVMMQVKKEDNFKKQFSGIRR